MIAKIISGGQTGADQGGLAAGRLLGLETGGHAPRGWRTQDGSTPELALFGLTEDDSPAYPPRTRKNVANSDGTLFFGNSSSPGGRLTIRYCRELEKPYFTVLWPDPGQVVDKLPVFRAWLAAERIHVLNVAGNREHTNPGICRAVSAFLILAVRPEGLPCR